MTGPPLAELESYLKSRFSELDMESSLDFGELSLKIPKESLRFVVKILRLDRQCRFEMLVDICGVDYPERKQRFEIVYQLLSLSLNQRIRLCVPASEDSPVPSLSDIWPVAEWYERECWDMFGVYFSDHPDLRRILTDYGFEGHPLRKDFPLSGHVELRYNAESEKLVYEPVSLLQEYRDFEFESPWAGMTPSSPLSEDARPEAPLPGDALPEGPPLPGGEKTPPSSSLSHSSAKGDSSS